MSRSIVTKAEKPSALPDAAVSNPHHVLKGGKRTGFKNPYPSYIDSNPVVMFASVAWGLLTSQIQQPDIKNVPLVPVRKPTWLPQGTKPDKLRATWLGHACYFVEFPTGLRVLFDPVFEDRCSPFKKLGPQRFTQPPCRLDELPSVDAVVISHSHYDHLSHDSVLQIQKKNPETHFFVGLGLEKWFRSSGLHNVTELDWWQDAELEMTSAKSSNSSSDGSKPDVQKSIRATVSCLPAQHTSARTPFDKDTTLWCSWAVRSGGKSVWFGGDTGYRTVPQLPKGADDYGPEYDALPRCPQFKQIGQHRGPFDLGLIPIGAYGPRHVFSHMHGNPHDAVEIFRDTQCRRAMGIHWATWALTYEAVNEPPQLLRDALRRRGIAEEGVFDVCEIGESREF